MEPSSELGFYTSRQPELLEQFEQRARWWQQELSATYSEAFAKSLIAQARDRFEELLPALPYIGGEENHLTGHVLDAARCLALYQAMRARGKTAAQTGKVLYDAILSRGQSDQPSFVGQQLTEDQLMERRRRRAERSQRRAYPDDWVYTFVPGDGTSFDYGYDFTECAAQKLFQRHGAGELLPFYCYLDFASSAVWGLGLTRSKTLANGDAICNHRFKRGRETTLVWPTPFLRHGADPAEDS